MKSFKIIFESGATETIRAESIELNEVLENVAVKGEDGKEIDEYYLDLESISAIIPQDNPK